MHQSRTLLHKEVGRENAERVEVEREGFVAEALPGVREIRELGCRRLPKGGLEQGDVIDTNKSMEIRRLCMKRSAEITCAEI